jgi:hypothetical protein
MLTPNNPPYQRFPIRVEETGTDWSENMPRERSLRATLDIPALPILC